MEKTSTAHKSHSKRGRKCKAKRKASKRLTMNGNEILHNAIPMVEDATITSTMSIAATQLMSVESPSTSAKKAHAIKGGKILDKAKSCEILSDGNKDLHLMIDEKIVTALSCQEKKDLNKFEVLSILSGSNNGDNSNSNSRVSNTSDKDMNSE
eukprot:356163-Ditylum_brightwellii.AAC.1